MSQCGALGYAPGMSRTLPDLIRARVLDAELAATLWLLVEGRVPVLVAADEPHSDASVLMHALLDLLPADVRTHTIAGVDETFDWLPQAGELGWDGQSDPPTPGEAPLIRAATTVLVAADVLGAAPSAEHGAVARILIRAAAIGYGVVMTVRATSLEDVLATLGGFPVHADQDELSRLGVVLVVGRVGGPSAIRVVAAHYVRPTARDEHGHVQRLGPAVLATWDPAADRFEHFGWGVTPELARRVGRRAGDFELEVARRRQLLGGPADPLGTS